MRVKFVIMHGTVTSHDAIGNDIEAMYRIISEKHTCGVYAINCMNDKVRYLSEKELDSWLGLTDTVVIYHHSVWWEHGYDKLKNFKGTIIFRYHNITPPEFFEPYNEYAYLSCRNGREQTEIMMRENPKACWLSASRFNVSELHLEAGTLSEVCPPFNKINEWLKTVPDESILQELVDTDVLNVLFVGRVAPNKGHLMMLEVIRSYIGYYNEPCMLRIVGKMDEGLAGYNGLITDRIVKYGLEDSVKFIGEINDATLMSYYLGSDVMLCCSEHEGFFVPAIEAQSLGLPVVALKECAVPETMGEHQICLEQNVKKFVAAIKLIHDNAEARKYFRTVGRDNYLRRFGYETIKEQFVSSIKKMTGVDL